MKTRAFPLAWSWLALFTLLVPTGAAEAVNASLDEPEDSPLFAQAVRRAFTQFAALDRMSEAVRGAKPEAAPTTSGTVVVEGERWYRLASEAAPAASAGPYGTPTPKGSTFDYSPTCVPTTCQVACTPTSHGGPTCAPNPSCTPSLTCASPTCGSIPTCSLPTCSDWPTCGGAPTCSTTCMGTCNIASCPAPVLYSVAITNNAAVSGQYLVQISFNASGTVKYTVQYCTNLNELQWSNIFSKLGDNSTTVFTHSNTAPRAFYRVLMQDQ